MSIKQNGGVFGRNPTFNNVDIDGQINGTTIPSNAVLARTDQAQTFIGDNVFPETSFTGHVKVSAGKGLAYSGNTATYMSPEDNIQGARIAAGGSFILSVDGGTEAIHVNGTNKNVTISNGNLVIGTSGNGIDFSATAGTGTSELLDDYEEGTWTPVYAPQTGSFATMTMEVYDAVYTKIGNTVFISAFMRTDNVDMGTASGTLRITGLPFAPSSVVSTGGVEVSFAGAFGGDYPLSGWFESSYIQLSYRTSVNGTSLSSIVTDLTAGATANQNTLRISGMYKTAS